MLKTEKSQSFHMSKSLGLKINVEKASTLIFDTPCTTTLVLPPPPHRQAKTPFAVTLVHYAMTRPPSSPSLPLDSESPHHSSQQLPSCLQTAPLNHQSHLSQKRFHLIPKQ